MVETVGQKNHCAQDYKTKEGWSMANGSTGDSMRAMARDADRQYPTQHDRISFVTASDQS